MLPFKEYEPKWQDMWFANKIFAGITDTSKPKYYILDMFPYPSGAGLHVGHVEGYTASDIISRYKRAQGFNVLHPMGWDAFGLPAERAAVRDGRHPEVITKENVTTFKDQLKSLGFSYDWDREISTTDPDYYKWTQWIFLKLYNKGLAYIEEVPVNWCPALGTVLANEEVQDGKYVETGDPVERRMMKQWMLKITAYADRLLADLETLDWPHGVLEMQRKWIGYSEGADVKFQIQSDNLEFDPERQEGVEGLSFTVFTTRPDTLFGATYCVFAPEHALVNKITTPAQKEEIDKYIEWAKNRSDRDRQIAAEKEKTGVFTGAFAVNPVNGEKLPIWIADYVLMSYGTGAIMAVPGHDERDHAFAKKNNLPIIQVISAPEGFDIQEEAWSGDGLLMNSGDFNELEKNDGIHKITTWLEEKSIGKKQHQYKLRDWLFSRQRYWGEPFPIMFDAEGKEHTVDEQDLPITLPFIEEYKPTEDGRPPLARNEEWVSVTKDGKTFTRETNTMPQWAGSCWYYLRFMDPKNTELPVGKEAENYWGPVDLYIGGVEHAVLHLLYARFWHKVLYDCGVVSTIEPFQKLFNQGIITAHSYKDKNGKYHSPEAVKEDGKGKWVLRNSGEPVTSMVEKMSKSKLNVVNPNDVIKEYGADCLRIYEMFMGPLEREKPWAQQGLVGVYKFLSKAWRMIVDDQGNVLVDNTKPSDNILRLTHKTIKKVTEDIESLSFNTAVSQLMIFVNEVTKTKDRPKEAITAFLKCLAPFAPHMAEELWERLGEQPFVSNASWPTFDAQLAKAEKITMAVQVNGKTRGTIAIDENTEEDGAVALAKEITFVQNQLAQGAQMRKIIYVKNRILNLIIK
ncbi:leucine--tRNA ligase [bacterium]|nr:leucine--tRNA ligase [bacterium]